MEDTKLHTLQEVEENFPNLRQVYFFTVKPDRQMHNLKYKSIINRLIEYFEKKHSVSFTVECISKTGFKHLHGILFLNSLEKDKKLKAIQRFVNRLPAYFKIEPVSHSIKSAYTYIMDEERNQPQQSYLRNPL